MTVIETVLVFVGIPAGAFALITIMVLGPGATRSPRYRPNGGWSYEPVWYLPHPAHDAPVSSLQVPGPAEASARLAIATRRNVEQSVTAGGGASGEW